MRAAGDAVQPTDHDRRPGHLRVVDRRRRLDARSQRARAFARTADQEAGLVGEVYDRQVEHIAEIDELLELARLLRPHRAAVVHWIVGQHADRQPADSRESGHLRTTVVAPELEERTQVDDHLEHPPDVVAAVAMLRDDGRQAVVSTIERIVAVEHRRQLMHIRRQIGEEPPNLLHRVRLVRRVVVDHAAAPRMDLVAAEFLLAQLLAHRALDQRRPTSEHLRGPTHHHRKMRGWHLGRGQPRDRAQRRRDDGHFGHQPAPTLRPEQLGQVGSTYLRRRADISAEAVDQPDHRDLQLGRQRLDMPRLVAAAVDARLAALGRFRFRPAARTRREVSARHRNGTPIDLRCADHGRRRVEAHQLARLVVVTGARQHAALPE